MAQASSIARQSKYFAEKIAHRAPRALIGGGVVREAWNFPCVDVRVGETVSNASVQMHLPIDARAAHFERKGVALFGRDDRIHIPLADEHFSPDRLRDGGHGCRQARVKTDRAREIGAAARQFEHGRAAKAEADRRDAPRIDIRLLFEQIEGSFDAGPQRRQIGSVSTSSEARKRCASSPLITSSNVIPATLPMLW